MEVRRLNKQQPPRYPKPIKIQTTTIESTPYSLTPTYNKDQRLTARLPKSPPAQIISYNQSPSHQGIQKRVALDSPMTPQEIVQREYQMYSRRNYGPRGKGQSDLTQQNKTNRQVHTSNDKTKSKSALEYAKYFIKQTSNPPTQLNSSRSQQAVEDGITVIIPVGEGSREYIDEETVLTQERSHKKHRTNIMQKINSFKNISKSNYASSSSRDPSLVERTEKSHSKRQKLDGSTSKGTISAKSLRARSKAKSRTRKIIMRVRQFNQAPAVLDSIDLMLNSKIDRSSFGRRAAETGQRVQLHLQLLNLLPAYVKQFKQIYQQSDCWDQLLFLAYKKFYLQRKKIQNSLSGHTIIQSPFRLPFASVDCKQLQDFSLSSNGVHLQQRLRVENIQISTALRELYNHMIEKAGRWINMFQVDDFGLQLYGLFGEEVKLLLQAGDNTSVRQRRIGLAIKCCYIVACLNGLEVDIEDLLGQDIATEGQIKDFIGFVEGLK